jgi:hypothetical protein
VLRHNKQKNEYSSLPNMERAEYSVLTIIHLNAMLVLHLKSVKMITFAAYRKELVFRQLAAKHKICTRR